MAKKEIKPMTVEERLKALYQLQTILSSIDEKRAIRGELPLEVKDLEDELEGLATRIVKMENEIKEFNDAIVLRKGDIDRAETAKKRYEAQLDEVKNNREYDMLTKEIEYQKYEIELCNKKINEGQRRVKDLTEELERTKQLSEERKGDLDQKKSELDEILKETAEEEEKLREKGAKLEEKIEPRLLASFKRIRHNARNGLGIVYVQRDACGGCFAKIPPQRQLDIKMHKKLLVCEYCGRILIDPELAGVKVEKATGEAKKTRKRSVSTRKSAASKKTTDANDME